MHGHHNHDTASQARAGHHGSNFGPPFPDRADRFVGTTRGRGRGRGRGRPDGFGPGFGRHGGFGPGFGRGPKARRGDVRAAILALLVEEPMHGYQIITELSERSGGVWRPSPGSVYPTLSSLEDQGLVTADSSAGRRVFSLTPEGRTEAEAAGDGPTPWEEAAGGDRSVVDLMNLMVQVMKATKQVAQAGGPGQIRTVGEILTDTRRKIYLVLADGEPADDDADKDA
jgi:DNA-binding PadR family transcriptional regulator